MNHFAHRTLAQNTLASGVGNLLGDFARGLDHSALPATVIGRDVKRHHDGIEQAFLSF